MREPEPELEPESETDDAFSSFDEEEPAVIPAVHDDGVEEAVVEDGPGLFDDEAPTESTSEEGGTGKRKRRRRRRKKSGGDAAPIAAGDAEETAPVAAVAFAEEHEPVAIGEAADEMDDEDGEEASVMPAADEPEDESTEPLPDWKVVAWTELVATLHRPQDHR